MVAAQGHPERAACLDGVAAALREATGLPRPPADRLTYDSALAVARTALGEEAFAAARAMGRSLPLERAIAAALGEEGPPGEV